MGGLYEGCWHKLDRAKHHFDELDNCVGAWTNLNTNPPHEFGNVFDARRDPFVFHVVSVEKVIVEWSLIAGGALTSFRAALDCLAHDLIGRGSEPHRKSKSGPQFTIGLHPKEFVNAIEKQVPGIAAEHRAIIERYQPCKWDEARDRHPFAPLLSLRS